MKSMLARGFTLIELLIVIAVLGILAVAVLSAINPIEQINRSRDTGSRSDAEQLLSAMDRFYANQAYYPWQFGAADLVSALAWGKVDSQWADDATPAVAVLTKLSGTGTDELKKAFTDRISASTYNFLYVYNLGGSGDSTYVCFAPKSGSFTNDAKTRCTTSGATPADFPGEACPQNGPYWSCLP